MKSFAVIGYPLAFTLSPEFHNYLFKLLAIEADYTALRTSGEDLANIARQLRDGQLHGINITLPHKTAFIDYLDEIASDTLPIGAVNCVAVSQNQLIGHNTDVTGVHYALQQQNFHTEGSTVLLIGTGGAARAAMVALQQSNANHISVAGRTKTTVTKFVNDFRTSAHHTTIDAKHLGPELETDPYDLLINATPVGMWPDIEDSPLKKEQLHKEQVIFDVVYHPEETLLLRWALDSGCRIISGIDMFIGQGLASLDHWFPNTVYAQVGILNPSIEVDTLKTVLKSALVNRISRINMIPTEGEPV
jgi:shikimate dehydrogenase